MTEIKDIRTGDAFSEISHYIVESVEKENIIFKHQESGTTVSLTHEYVKKLLVSADQYDSVVTVGKEDKLWTANQIAEQTKKGLWKAGVEIPKVGDVRLKGMRTIWQEIYSAEVFVVCYKKADEPLSASKFNELLQQQRDKAVEAILDVQSRKKGVAKEAQKQLQIIQQNPVLPFKEGEMRYLRGYKLEFESRDGKYLCKDLDINDVRPVNINTINTLVYKGVKYQLEK